MEKLKFWIDNFTVYPCKLSNGRLVGQLDRFLYSELPVEKMLRLSTLPETAFFNVAADVLHELAAKLFTERIVNNNDSGNAQTAEYKSILLDIQYDLKLTYPEVEAWYFERFFLRNIFTQVGMGQLEIDEDFTLRLLAMLRQGEEAFCAEVEVNEINQPERKVVKGRRKISQCLGLYGILVYMKTLYVQKGGKAKDFTANLVRSCTRYYFKS